MDLDHCDLMLQFEPKSSTFFLRLVSLNIAQLTFLNLRVSFVLLQQAGILFQGLKVVKLTLKPFLSGPLNSNAFWFWSSLVKG